MEKERDQQTRTDSKTRFVEQINICLNSGDYSHALDLLRGATAKFPNDADLSKLEQLAQDGIKRNAEANRLITESQDLFAQRKSAEAIQLLREAYALDKHNSLARAILANALVEHAHSILETDWLGAETLTNQALALNPAHPTAKTIQNLIVEQKKNSSVDDWVTKAQKLQSSGDLFAALAWVAEGLAVHPDDHKLLQIHDAIQRDQSARRRQARRGDLEALRRMELEVDGTTDVAAKQALAERIQTLAAKYWTDGEILSIANGLVNRLGLAPKEGSTALPASKGGPVIFRVPRPGTPNPARADTKVPPNAAQGGDGPTATVPQNEDKAGKVPPSVVPGNKVASAPTEPQTPTLPAASIPVVELSPPAVKITPPSPQPQKRRRSHATTVILVATVAVIAVLGIIFFTRKHHGPPIVKTSSAAPAASTAVAPSPNVTASPASAPEIPAPPPTAVEQRAPERSPLPSPIPSDAAAAKTTAEVTVPAEPGHNTGTLLVVAGQDDAQVFVDGKVQPQRTQGGVLRLPNLEPKDYVVQVSKSGFQDPPQQKIRIHQGQPVKLTFDLQPQPRMASLSIQGGAPETTVLLDQTVVGTIQSDGTLAVSTIDPGDHTVELHNERFKSRQFKKHFVAGGTISLSAADAALEAASGELKITFAPADATVAIAKGELLKIVSSGIPLNLPAGTYTLTTRTPERITRSSSVEVVGGQSKTLALSLAPNGMSKWEDPSAWKHERDSFIRKGGDFVLYGVAPASGTFVFSAMPAKGHLLQWVLNYSDPKNYVLFQLDDTDFYRAVIRNGAKTNEMKVPAKGDKKSFRTLQVRVGPTEIVHQIKQGDSWTLLDRCAQSSGNLNLGKFGFYIPGNDQVALVSFAHYTDLNVR